MIEPSENVHCGDDHPSNDTRWNQVMLNKCLTEVRANRKHANKRNAVWAQTCLGVWLKLRHMWHVYILTEQEAANNRDQSRSLRNRGLAEAESVSILHYLCFVSVSAFLWTTVSALSDLAFGSTTVFRTVHWQLLLQLELSTHVGKFR